MRKASRRLSHFYDSALAPAGLKSTQYSILSEISRRAETPPTMWELADALVMDRSTLGHNLGPLERDQLISLENHATDRRRKQVVLTRKGRTVLAKSKKLWHVAQDHFEASFGIREAAELRGILLGIAADSSLVQPVSTSTATR
jgi:DNA-binding MarR family transcriptional regulator